MRNQADLAVFSRSKKRKMPVRWMRKRQEMSPYGWLYRYGYTQMSCDYQRKDRVGLVNVFRFAQRLLEHEPEVWRNGHLGHEQVSNGQTASGYFFFPLLEIKPGDFSSGKCAWKHATVYCTTDK